MARLNRFGAVHTQIVSMYPGTVVPDYDGGGANGQTVIESVLDRIAREVSAAMTPDTYRQMTEVDCEQVVMAASQGQTSFSLGMTPVIAGSVHVWRYPSLASQEIRNWGLTPDYATNWQSDDWFRKPVIGYNEVSTSDYTVTLSTGAVSFPAGLSQYERVYASYNVDISSATFSMASLQDITLLGTAGELGSRLYSESTQEWKLVTQYQERYKAAIENMLAGKWIPDELRALTYWTDVERQSDTVVSVRSYRT